MERFDDGELQRRMRRNVLGNRLAVEKNYLKAQILRSMRAFHAEKNIEAQLDGMMMDLRFLYQKKLYSQFSSALRRAKKLAEKHEHFQVLVELGGLERRFFWERPGRKAGEVLESILDEMRTASERLFNKNGYTDLLNRIYSIIRGTALLAEKSREEALEEIIQHPLLADVSRATTFSSRLYFHQIHAIYHQLQNHLEAARDHYRQVLNTWESHPNESAYRQSQYRRGLANYLAICHLLEDYSEFGAVLALIRESPGKTIADRVEKFDLLAHYGLIQCFGKADFDAGEKLANEIISQLPDFEQKLSDSRKSLLWLNLAVLFLFRENWSDSLKWVNTILDAPASTAGENTRHQARLWLVLLHYELENYDLLEYLTRAQIRYFKSLDGDYGAELAVLKFFSTLAEKSSAEASAAFANLKSRLETPQGRQSSVLREVNYWVAARLQGKKVSEVFRNSLG